MERLTQCATQNIPASHFHAGKSHVAHARHRAPVPGVVVETREALDIAWVLADEQLACRFQGTPDRVQPNTGCSVRLSYTSEALVSLYFHHQVQLPDTRSVGSRLRFLIEKVDRC